MRAADEVSVPGVGVPVVRARPARRRWLPFAGTTLAAAAAVGLLGAVDPNRPGHYPTCPLLLVSGLWCPGCGAMRAVHDLVHLDLGGALARNPLVVLLVPVLACAWVVWLLRLTGRRAPSARVGPRSVGAFVGLLVAYWVLRNVPGWTWLSPA